MKKLIKDIYDTNKKWSKSKDEHERLARRAADLNRRMDKIKNERKEAGYTDEAISELKEIKSELSRSHELCQITKRDTSKLKKELGFYENSLLSLIKTTPPRSVDSLEALIIIQSITNYKQKYRDFSRDLTRVSSMRAISSQIADDLDEVINQYMAHIE